MRTMNSYSKYIVVVIFTLLSFCALKAQTKSSITRLDYCYEGEKVFFEYNFKNAGIDTASFIITFFPSDDLADSIDKTITFKKKSQETIELPKIGNMIRIKYFDNGEEKTKKVNLNNFQRKGPRHPKKEYDD